jgi:hypothetical protein
MATKATIMQAVKDLCPSRPKELSALDAYLAIALEEYSKDHAYEDVVNVTGEGANLLSTPTGWQDHASRIRRIVYPYVDEDSTVLEGDDYDIDSIVGPTEKIRFHAFSPSTSEAVRVWFTRPHVCDATTCTVYDHEKMAFASLIASKLEQAKADHFGGLTDQGLTAQLVDYGGKSAQAQSLADMHYKSYRKALGLGEDGPKAAAVFVDIDVEPLEYGYMLSRHGSRRR